VAADAHLRCGAAGVVTVVPLGVASRLVVRMGSSVLRGCIHGLSQLKLRMTTPRSQIRLLSYATMIVAVKWILMFWVHNFSRT